MRGEVKTPRIFGGMGGRILPAKRPVALGTERSGRGNKAHRSPPRTIKCGRPCPLSPRPRLFRSLPASPLTAFLRASRSRPLPLYALPFLSPPSVLFAFPLSRLAFLFSPPCLSITWLLRHSPSLFSSPPPFLPWPRSPLPARSPPRSPPHGGAID